MMATNSKANTIAGGIREMASRNPAVERLMSEAESYVRNRAQGLVSDLGDRITDATGRLEGIADNGGALKTGAKAMAEGDSPVKAGLKAGATSVKEKVGGLLGGGGGQGGEVKATQIAEQIDIGVPVSVAYNQWTQFQEFSKFTKGVESVEQTEDTKTKWRAKVAFSHRSWDATITEQIPDERIAWKSDGEKGHVDGVVTFHEIAPNLTRVMLELEYYPKGFVEKTGNLWRAQGRRARLDLKHFRRFVMMRGEETGEWRGEVRDGEVKQPRGRRGGISGSSGGKSPGGRADRRTSSSSSTSGSGRSSGNGSRTSRSAKAASNGRRSSKSEKSSGNGRSASSARRGAARSSSSSSKGGASNSSWARKSTTSSARGGSSSSSRSRQPAGSGSRSK